MNSHFIPEKDSTTHIFSPFQFRRQLNNGHSGNQLPKRPAKSNSIHRAWILQIRWWFRGSPIYSITFYCDYPTLLLKLHSQSIHVFLKLILFSAAQSVAEYDIAVGQNGLPHQSYCP